MVSDGRFITQLAEECPGLDVHIRPPSQTTVPAVAKVLTGLGFRQVGFESSHLTVADFEWLKSLAPTIDWATGSTPSSRSSNAERSERPTSCEAITPAMSTSPARTSTTPAVRRARRLFTAKD